VLESCTVYDSTDTLQSDATVPTKGEVSPSEAARVTTLDVGAAPPPHSMLMVALTVVPSAGAAT